MSAKATSSDAHHNAFSRMVRHHELHPDLQRQMYEKHGPESENYDWRKISMLGANRNLHPEIQDKIADLDSPPASLVTNPTLSLKNQRKISKKISPVLMGTLALNDGLHPEMQKELSNHNDINIRRKLASNSSLSGEVHQKLLEDPDMTVRLSASYNPKTSKDARDKVHAEHLEDVINRAKKIRDTSPVGMSDQDFHRLIDVTHSTDHRYARNPHIDF